MTDIKCDWHGTCKRRPYCEVYHFNGDHYWSFLCGWHYILDRLKHRHKNGYCILNKESVKNAIEKNDLKLLD